MKHSDITFLYSFIEQKNFSQFKKIVKEQHKKKFPKEDEEEESKDYEFKEHIKEPSNEALFKHEE